MDKEMRNLKLMVRLYSTGGFLSLGLGAYALFKGSFSIAVIFLLLALLTSMKADLTLLEYKGNQFSKVLKLLTVGELEEG